MEKYSHEEYLRIAKISDSWYRKHGFLSAFLILGLIPVFTGLLYYVYLGFCSLLPLEGSWYFQHVVFFAIPAAILAIPAGPLVGYRIMRLSQPKDYRTIIDLMSVKASYDGPAGFRWMFRGAAIVAAILVLFLGWSYMSVKKDGVSIKDVWAISAKHYSYNEFKQAIHYKRSYDQQKGVYPDDHYNLMLNDGRHFWDLAPVSDDPMAYEKAIIEMGNIPVVEADVDR